jgi:hypothetical protein
MKSRLIILFFSLLVLTVCSVSKKQSLDVLICLNSKSPEVVKAREFLIPYMEHFGMPYHILDIGESAFPEDIQDHALIVIGHPGISAGIDNDHLVQLVRSAAKKGTGIVLTG